MAGEGTRRAGKPGQSGKGFAPSDGRHHTSIRGTSLECEKVRSVGGDVGLSFWNVGSGSRGRPAPSRGAESDAARLESQRGGRWEEGRCRSAEGGPHLGHRSGSCTRGTRPRNTCRDGTTLGHTGSQFPWVGRAEAKHSDQTKF